MSKYFNDISQQLEGKDVKAFTDEIKASNNISKILNEQKEKIRRKKVNDDIQRLLNS